MNQLLAIALGGAFGAVTRFLVASGIHGWMGRGFPHGTLFINISGSFLMGLLSELLIVRFAVAAEFRAAILVGFLGAYTTFSSFALETLALVEQGSLIKAFLNVLLSVLLCMAAVWIGLIWGRSLFAGGQPGLFAQGQAYYWLIAVWIVAFGFSVAVVLGLHYFGLSREWQTVVLVSLLGLITVVLTLWVVLGLINVRLEPLGLFMVFSLNGLLGTVILWLANILGNWLWQNNLSR